MRASTQPLQASFDEEEQTIRSAVRLRRIKGYAWIALVLFIDLFATGLFGGSERALAIARTVVLPGLAFLEWNWMIGAATMVIAFSAIYLWMRWGMDWIVLLVLACSLFVAAFVMPMHEHGAGDGHSHHHHAPHDHSSHDHGGHGHD